MSAIYVWDPSTGTYILTDTGAYAVSTDGSFNVTTDQPDYAPLSTATFTVAGVNAGDTVTFEVTDLNGIAVSGTSQPWTVVASASGALQTTWGVGADAAGQAFELTVVDQTTGVVTTATFTDSPAPPPGFNYLANLTHLDTGTGLPTATVGDALFANAGNAIVTNATSSGTGQFGTFVQIQNNGAEQGFNTNANDLLDTKNSNIFNHPLQLGDLQTVNGSGVADAAGTFYEFRLDIHQSNSKPDLSLDDLQIWQSANPALSDFTNVSGTPPAFSFGSDATPVYQLDSPSNEMGGLPNTILLNSTFTSGSGGGADLVVLIPTADFNASNGNFVYLYSAFGYQGGQFSANSTFEEWGTLLKSTGTIGGGGQGPALSLTKTVVSAVPQDQVGDGPGPLVDHAGETITYNVVLTNTGGADVTGVTLSDSLVSNLSGATFFDTGTLTDHMAYASLADALAAGVLDGGETWTLTYTYNAIQSDLNNDGNPALTGSIQNTVTVTTNELPSVSAFAAVNVDQDPSWSVFKDVAVSAPTDKSDPEAAQPVESHPHFDVPAATVVDTHGQTLSYTVTLVNTGNVDIAGSDIVVSDSYEGAAATLLDNIGVITGATLTSSDHVTSTFDVGATWTFTYSHTVTQDELNSNGSGDGLLSNTVTASTVDGVLSTQMASTSVVVDQDPAINVEKLVSVDGGVNWYTLSDANDSQGDSGAATLNTIHKETGIALADLHYGTPVLTDHAGNPSPMYEFVITNTGNVDLDNVKLSDSLYSNVSLPSNTSLAVGADTIVKITEPFQAGDNLDTATAMGTIHSGSTTVTDTDNADYTGFQLGSAGLTQGFWANHSAAWDGKADTTWGNIVDKPGGLFGDAFTAHLVSVAQQGNKFTGNDDILNALTGHGATGVQGDVLLGDANGNGIADPGEVTKLLPNSQALGDLTTSAGGNAQTIMLSQLVAAQLNVYNGDQDPGVANLASKAGHDLIGEAVQWLNGTLVGEGGASTSTSGAQWNSKFFDTGIANPSNPTHDIMVSGQDIKNVLQAFNQDQIVTSKDGGLIGWSNDGGITVVGVHANTPDEFWLVAQQHGVITG